MTAVFFWLGVSLCALAFTGIVWAVDRTVRDFAHDASLRDFARFTSDLRRVVLGREGER